MNVVQSKQVFK